MELEATEGTMDRVIASNVKQISLPPSERCAASGWLVIACLAWGSSVSPAIGEFDRSPYSEFYNPFSDDLADEWLERSVTTTGLVHQPYMRELPWGTSSDIPAFF